MSDTQQTRTTPTPPPPAPPPHDSAGDSGLGMVHAESAGLTFGVARTLGEVVDAWSLVYGAYRVAGLIPHNDHGLHTAPHAVGPHAAVIRGCIGDLTVSTLTVINDHDSSLPLDRVYHDELQALRQKGSRLLEVGLFADRRKKLSRTAESLFQLMRYCFYFGESCGVTDYVIGVHPRHARFYARAFGFEYHGQEKTYAAVNDHPVVMLYGEIARGLSLRPLHPALDYFVRCPVDPTLFEHRYRFPSEEVAASPVGRFMDDYHRSHPMPAADPSPRRMSA